MRIETIPIKDQIRNAVEFPELVTTLHEELQPQLSSIERCLTSQYLKRVSKDELHALLTNSPHILLPDYLELYNQFQPSTQISDQWGENVFGISEYFSNIDRWIVSPEYLKFAKSSPDEIVMNVYGNGSFPNSQIGRTPSWEDELLRRKLDFASKSIPECEISTPQGPIKVASFNNALYHDNVLVESAQDPISVLCINLPYQYFSTQNNLGNLFTWDLDNEKYLMLGKEIPEINTMLDDMVTNGIQPLVMRLHAGRLSSVDMENYLVLLLATYLHLPTIPVILYMSDDYNLSHHYADELSALSQTLRLGMDVVDTVALNKICKPYFLFENVPGSDSTIYINVDDEQFLKTQYPSPNNIDDESIVILDRYLDRSVDISMLGNMMTPEEMQESIDTKNAELKAELDAKLAKESAEIYRKILAGEF